MPDDVQAFTGTLIFQRAADGTIRPLHLTMAAQGRPSATKEEEQARTKELGEFRERLGLAIVGLGAQEVAPRIVVPDLARGLIKGS
jgi:hypothetical protein